MEIIKLRDEFIKLGYAAVMEVKNGCSVWSTGRKYGMDTRTLRQFIYRYDHQGYKGLEDRPLHKFTESDKFSILIEYESGSISKEDLCIKHGIRENVLKEWLEQYEQYKKGDKFAMSRGRQKEKNRLLRGRIPCLRRGIVCSDYAHGRFRRAAAELVAVQCLRNHAVAAELVASILNL